MRVLLQRVLSASVAVDGEQIAGIGRGLLAFVGVFPNDTETQVNWLADKTLGLRIFPEAGSAADTMNASVVDVAGELLVVSQFTLAADVSRGRRPGFSTAAPPERAEQVYEQFVTRLRAAGSAVQTGRFGADMQVELVNDGPVTFLLEK